MRRLLLDTHAFLWWLADDSQLGSNARQLIEEGSNIVYVSAVSAWEISIKKSLGKLEAPDDLGQILGQEGFEELPITFFHAERAGELPPIHHDPFDRMLVAQAQAEGLDIITRDENIPKYGIKTIAANV